MRTDVNYKKEDWDLFFASSMAASQIDPNGPEIGCYVEKKSNKIHSHEKERHITD